LLKFCTRIALSPARFTFFHFFHFTQPTTMATRNAFGQTWWGAQWLEALAQIDFSNRLPRGRTYANNGSVKQMAIGGGQITAKVKGSRPQPYQISITVPPLPEKQAQALMDAVARDPLIISKLLNRELDPAVLDLANDLKIGVFPRTWKDLSMRCSCPDSAVPCKHLAAVIYLVSREIDGNPFMVFSLRGLDLIAALKGKNIEVAREAQAALPTLHQLLAAHSLPLPADGSTGDAAHAAAHAYTSTAAAVPLAERVLDYTTVPDLADVLPAVLTANPAFFPRADFRVLYDKILRRIAKAARQELAAPAAPAAPAPLAADAPPGPDDKPRLVLAANGQISVLGLAAERHLFDSLRQLNDAMLADLQPELAALYHARMLCLHLLARGALVPQLLDAGQGATGLRWLPALQDAAVRRLMQQLAALLPPDLLLLQAAPSSRSKSARAGALSRLTPEAQANTLCSVLLDAMVLQWSEVDSEKPHGDKVLKLFFGEHRSLFNGPGEASLAQAMQAWLARFHLTSMAHAPLLCLSDQAGKADFYSVWRCKRRAA
jgi:uncharacterized Zn finger protein